MLDIDLTNPLLNSKDLKDFLKYFERFKNQFNGQFVITESRKNPYFNILRKINNGYKVCNISNKIFSRQKAPKTFDHVAGFYIFKTKYILKCNWYNYLSKKIKGYEVPFYKTIDIDTLNDLKLSELIFKNIKNFL